MGTISIIAILQYTGSSKRLFYHRTVLSFFEIQSVKFEPMLKSYRRGGEKPKMYVQIGLVSFGMACGQGQPGVYTRISSFQEWIMTTLLKMSEGNKKSTIYYQWPCKRPIDSKTELNKMQNRQ